MKPNIRSDLAKSLDVAWQRVSEAGTWWTGAERVAIAAETRQAVHCELCLARKQASSPAMVSGEHDKAVDLPRAAIEAIHRIRTDSGRLGQGWYRSLIAAGLLEEHYVELLAVVSVVVATDTFHRAAGLPPRALSSAVPRQHLWRRFEVVN